MGDSGKILKDFHLLHKLQKLVLQTSRTIMLEIDPYYPGEIEPSQDGNEEDVNAYEACLVRR